MFELLPLYLKHHLSLLTKSTLKNLHCLEVKYYFANVTNTFPHVIGIDFSISYQKKIILLLIFTVFGKESNKMS